jgi:hypothetical protein
LLYFISLLTFNNINNVNKIQNFKSNNRKFLGLHSYELEPVSAEVIDWHENADDQSADNDAQKY